MKLLFKTTALLLLIVMLFSMVDVFIPNSISSPEDISAHTSCFGVDCGPIQHMFHVYVVPEATESPSLAINTFFSLLIKEFPHSLILSPDSPPPKSFLV